MATEREVYNALTGAGFSMTQAAGIMGNIQNESSYNQEAIGDAGTSFGLVQWHYPGYPFAPSLVTGNLPDDFADQIPYIVQASKGVNMGGTASQVAGNWASQFERCVGCQPGGAQYISRQQNADRIYQQAKSGNWPSGPGQGGGPGGGQPAGVSPAGLIGATGTVWGIPITWLEPSLQQVSGIVTATEDVAQAAAQIGNAISTFMSWIAWWFVPSHLIRVAAFILGAPLVGFGIFNLTRTGKDYSAQVAGFTIPMSGGSTAPVIGIAEVMVGSMLLFVAFHNLPASVNDLPSLLTYIQGNVATPGEVTVNPQ